MKTLICLVLSLFIIGCDESPERQEYINNLIIHQNEYFQESSQLINSGILKGCNVVHLGKYQSSSLIAIKCPDNSTVTATYLSGKIRSSTTVVSTP